MNELLTNTLKHAFPEGTNGQIKISVAAIDSGEVEIIISDNGVGFPGDTDFRNAAGLGLELVVGIVEKQLEGHIELNQEEGTQFRIRFKTQKNTEEA
jgi:two-component sensor histidine kinase